MDNIYQSIKAFLKSFLNLFLAVLDLFTSLINGLAAILMRLRPCISQRYTDLKKEREHINTPDGLKLQKRKGYTLEFKGNEEKLVEEIRNELKQKVSSKEKYYYLNTYLQNNGIGYYAVVLSIFVFALAGTVMLYSTSSLNRVRILAAVIMAILCAVACIAIAKEQKKIVRNKLVKQILNEEFRDKDWEKQEKTENNPEAEEAVDADGEVKKEEPEKSKEIAKIQSISVVGKEIG